MATTCTSKFSDRINNWHRNLLSELRVFWIVIFLVTSLTSCQTLEAPSNVMKERRGSVTSVSVKIGEFAPTEAAATGASIAESTVEGGMTGAAGGVAGLGMWAPACLSAGPYSAAACAVLLPIVGVIALAGGALGAAMGAHEGEMRAQMQQMISTKLATKEVQIPLIKHIANYGSANTNIRFVSFDQTLKPADSQKEAMQSFASLEVAILEIDVTRSYGDTNSISIDGRASLIQATDGAVLADRTYRYLSAPRTPADWSADGGVQLASSIEFGYQQIAEWIVEDFFLVMNEPIIDFWRIFPQPELPSIQTCFFCGLVQSTSGRMKATLVELLRPTLKWRFDLESLRNAFVSDQTKPRTLFGKEPKNLQYEVRIYSTVLAHTTGGGFSGSIYAAEPIYTRTGLTNSLHLVENDLEPCTIYLWTVRAHYKLDSHYHTTEWASVSLMSPKKERAKRYDLERLKLSNYYYPFSTPCSTN